MTRPRAADDFAAIRARMEELRRARARALAGDDPGPAIGPRPYYFVGREPPPLTGKSVLLGAIRRAVLK